MLFWDCEADGLLDTITRVHCITICWDDDAPAKVYHDDSRFPADGTIAEALSLIQGAPKTCTHNGTGYDIWALRKLYPGFELQGEHNDTQVIGRFLYPDKRQMGDHKRDMPGRLKGSHSLEAWGLRLGFEKLEVDGYDELTEEMITYGKRDTELTRLLYTRLMDAKPPASALRVEHDFAEILARQQLAGCRFDVDRAEAIVAGMTEEYAELHQTLVDSGPRRVAYVYKRPQKDGRTHRDEPFNPGSSKQVGDWLQSLGWKPDTFTDGGQAKVSADILNTLPYPEAKQLTRHRLLSDRITQMQGWIKKTRADGRLSAGIIHNGTITHRCGHRVVTSVPKPGTPLADEFREPFTAAPGYTLVGWDASGLELRCLAHILAEWDGGAWGRELIEGDVHERNRVALDAVVPGIGRSRTKNCVYALLYGAQDPKLGWTATGTWRGARARGRAVRQALMAGMPGLAKAMQKAQAAYRRGWFEGLDGRRVAMRHKHSSLNSLCQSMGALLMKWATVLYHRLLVAEGLRPWMPGEEYDFAQVGHWHDEALIEVRPEHVDVAQRCASEAMEQAAEALGFRCPVAADALVGSTWKAVH